MKRILALMLVMGLFYITMSSFSSAQQEEVKSKSNKLAATQSSDKSDKQEKSKSSYNRDELKTGLARAFYDALLDAEDDLEDEEFEGQDGKKRSAFQEARRTIFQADPILARIKAENKKALAKLRNPPRRILPGQKRSNKKQAAQGKQTLKQQIEAQEKIIKQHQNKLNQLKKEFVSVPEKS